MAMKRVKHELVSYLRHTGRVRREHVSAYLGEAPPPMVELKWAPPPGAADVWCRDHEIMFKSGDPAHAECETFDQSAVVKGRSVASDAPNLAATPKPITSGILGWDRALANIATGITTVVSGIFEGLWVQITGEPGVGKSTLIEKVIHRYAIQGARVLRHSGEESTSQIAVRMQRERTTHPNIKLFFSQSWPEIAQEIVLHRPHIVVLDSLNTIGANFRDDKGRFREAPPKSETAMRIVNKAIAECCKEGKLGDARFTFRPVFFVVRQINTRGEASGEKANDHAPDALLSLRHDGDKRRLDVGKTRFGGIGPAFFAFRNGVLSESVSEGEAGGFGGLGGVGVLCAPVIRDGKAHLALVEASVDFPHGKERPTLRAVGFPVRHLDSVLRALSGEETITKLLEGCSLTVRVSRVEGEVRDDGLEMALATAILSVAFKVRLPSLAAFGAFRLNRDTEPVVRPRERQRAAGSGRVAILLAPTGADLEESPGLYRLGNVEALVAWVLSQPRDTTEHEQSAKTP